MTFFCACAVLSVFNTLPPLCCRPGLKFLVQKVAQVPSATNLYQQTILSWTARSVKDRIYTSRPSSPGLQGQASSGSTSRPSSPGQPGQSRIGSTSRPFSPGLPGQSRIGSTSRPSSPGLPGQARRGSTSRPSSPGLPVQSWRGTTGQRGPLVTKYEDI